MLESREEFERHVAEMLRCATRYGIQKVPVSGQEELRQRREAFVAACHEGYAKAQDQIAEGLVTLDLERQGEEQALRAARASHDRAAAEVARQTLREMEWRETVLRKLADSLAWILLQGQQWMVRRFYLGRRPTSLRDCNLASALEMARQINRDPQKFAVVSDLTTFVQVGDLIVIDWECGGFTVLELKEGEANQYISEAISTFSKAPDPGPLHGVVQRYGRTGLDQMKRMFEQNLRTAKLLEVLNEEKGEDLFLGKPIHIPQPEFVEGDWHHVLTELASQSEKGGASFCEIDGCLVVGVFDMSQHPNPSFAFRHEVYHFRHPEQDCLLLTEPDEAAVAQLQERLKLDGYPVFNLLHGLSIPVAKPIFILPVKPSYLLDFVFGRKLALAFLDFEKWFKLAQSFELEANWLSTRKEASAEKRFKDLFVRLGKRPVFRHGEAQLEGHDGLITRIVFGGVTPSSVLSILREILDTTDFQSATE